MIDMQHLESIVFSYFPIVFSSLVRLLVFMPNFYGLFLANLINFLYASQCARILPLF